MIIQIMEAKKMIFRIPIVLTYDFFSETLRYDWDHGLRTPSEGINQRNLKIGADVADKICFCRT